MGKNKGLAHVYVLEVVSAKEYIGTSPVQGWKTPRGKYCIEKKLCDMIIL